MSPEDEAKELLAIALRAAHKIVLLRSDAPSNSLHRSEIDGLVGSIERLAAWLRVNHPESVKYSCYATERTPNG